MKVYGVMAHSTPIVERKSRALSKWVSLIDVVIRNHDGAHELYHGMELADYVVMCARTSSGLFPVVRQFRPIIGIETLEFPGGMVEPGEPARDTAAREFQEETGLTVERLTPLGNYWTDTGRLTNKTHGFFAEIGGVDERTSVPELDVSFLTRTELETAMNDGRLGFLHVGVYALAKARGFV
jgi:8-oxo-dGTP pyrophosphatase MutT (NUDIX family)